MSRRVRYSRPPPIISLKCYLVASAVWGRVVLVRIQVGRPVFALVSLVVEVLFCNQGVEVRFLPGAPVMSLSSNGRTLIKVILLRIQSAIYNIPCQGRDPGSNPGNDTKLRMLTANFIH